MPTDPKTFFTGPPHVGQASSGSSEKDWTTSKVRSHCWQRYSYVGTGSAPFTRWSVVTLRTGSQSGGGRPVTTTGPSLAV